MPAQLLLVKNAATFDVDGLQQRRNSEDDAIDITIDETKKRIQGTDAMGFCHKAEQEIPLGDSNISLC